MVRKQTLSHLRPTEIFPGNSVKKAKITDVNNLLTKHFGNEWRKDDRLAFFIPILDADATEGNNDEENVDEPCEMFIEPEDLIV